MTIVNLHSYNRRGTIPLLSLFMIPALIILLLLSSISCTPPSGHETISEGSGEFSYTIQKRPFKGKTLPVYYHIPKGDIRDMKVLFVIPGMGRGGATYRDAWVESSDRWGFAVLTPQCTEDNFPEEVYQQGNVLSAEGKINPSEDMIYGMLGEIFHFYRDNTGSQVKRYNLYGHSAGGQFSHRFATFCPTDEVDNILPANAGWYTFPTDTISYPYGLGDAEKVLGPLRKRLYGRKVTLLLGEADTLRTSNLRMTEEADAQGLNRLSRGKAYFEFCRKDAQTLGVPFNWRLRFVSGAGHNNKLMAPTAAEVLAMDGPRKGDFRRKGSFSTFFTPGNRFKENPVRVNCFVPDNFNPRTAKVLMVMHGGHRETLTAIKEWIPFAQKGNILLLGVDFDAERYPNRIFLNGGLLDDEGGFVPESESLYPIIDEVFDEARRQLHLRAKSYDIFGHSAGGQMAHRFLLFHKSDKVGKTVASNAGWYTFPSDTIPFPYGIKECASLYGIDTDEYFAKDMTILLGQADTVVNFGLRMNEKTLWQGSRRLSRGEHFYHFAKENASGTFAWSLEELPGVGHDEVATVKAAARILYKL